VLALLGPGPDGSAATQEPWHPSAERRRIAEQQDQARARFVQEERECQQRFVVTACVDEARRRQREQLASLNRQSAVLDDYERRQRAADRSLAIRERISAEEARQRQQAAPPRQPRTLPLKPPSEVPGGAATMAPAAAAASAADVQRGAREARSRATFNARQAEAQSHRESAERRALQRQQNRGAAAPLPVPSAPAR
jgi:hypothetical protein